MSARGYAPVAVVQTTSLSVRSGAHLFCNLGLAIRAGEWVGLLPATDRSQHGIRWVSYQQRGRTYVQNVLDLKILR